MQIFIGAIINVYNLNFQGYMIVVYVCLYTTFRILSTAILLYTHLTYVWSLLNEFVLFIIAFMDIM